jgi:hypothetical protein
MNGHASILVAADVSPLKHPSLNPQLSSVSRLTSAATGSFAYFATRGSGKAM